MRCIFFKENNPRAPANESRLLRIIIIIIIIIKFICIYILNKVCRKYAEGMQCITLTLSTYLVLQQLNLHQTAKPYFAKCIKTLNNFVETFFSPDVHRCSFILRLVGLTEQNILLLLLRVLCFCFLLVLFFCCSLA